VKLVTDSDAAVIHPTAKIARSAVIGSPFRPLLDGRQVSADRRTVIEADVWVGQFCSVGQGVRIGVNSILEDYVGIQNGSVIGQRVLVASRARLGMGVTVGDDSVIKGHVGDSARIGMNCRIAGDLIHRQLDPTIPWDDPAAEEPSPIVADGAFIGWRAVVIGGVNIGAGTYVCAGALVTIDIPPGHIVYGRNQIVHPSSWRGALGKSPFFHSAPGLSPSSAR
jgi:acetyltransferase-like isoleucine patch superfamily enzyme